MVTLPAHYLVVPDDLIGVQVEDFLARSFPAADRTQLRRLIEEGRLTVNGQETRVRHRLNPGDLVDLGIDPSELRSVARPKGELAVLHETEHLVVVDKPAGMHTVPDRSGKERGVHGLLSELRPGADLRIAHRLDRDTSGCLVLAKGLTAARHLDALFGSGGVQKEYLALVDGVVHQDEGTVELFLGPDTKRPGKVVASATQRRGHREARTDWKVEKRFATHTLLRVLPRTGRGHQIRVHLAAIGHPICSDADYGGAPLLLSSLKSGYKRRAGVVEAPLLRRMFLHAARIVLRDVDGALVDVSAPLPDDLASALDRIERHGSKWRPPCD